MTRDVIRKLADDEIQSNESCENCGRDQTDRPMAFRGYVFCSDDCRKALGLDWI